jgi:Domain of unknown function (DUF4397)
MNTSTKFLLACIPALMLAACGGDSSDRLDISGPQVRFMHASEVAPNLTLYRAGVAQGEASDTAYKFAADYYGVDESFADWTVKTTAGAITIGTASIDASRGTLYTIVALPASAASTGLYIIADPYDKPIGSNSTRLRLMNGRFGAGDLDTYVNAPGTDIAAAGVGPLIAATAYANSGPRSGDDSHDLPAGTYQVTITAAGTKQILFQGQIAFGDNKDILLVALHHATLPGMVQALFKSEGTGGLIQIAPL